MGEIETFDLARTLRPNPARTLGSDHQRCRETPHGATDNESDEEALDEAA